MKHIIAIATIISKTLCYSMNKLSTNTLKRWPIDTQKMSLRKNNNNSRRKEKSRIILKNNQLHILSKIIMSNTKSKTWIHKLKQCWAHECNIKKCKRHTFQMLARRNKNTSTKLVFKREDIYIENGYTNNLMGRKYQK